MPSPTETPPRHLDADQRAWFTRELKAARATALRDAEAFDELLFALERLGSFRSRSHRGLSHYRAALESLAVESALAADAAVKFPGFHLSFHALYDEVKVARNDAMHQGTVARHLSRHAQELALIMEDALMQDAKTAMEFMVRDPVCAKLWQPISAILRAMLLNSFTFLPFLDASRGWRLLSDRNLVSFLRDVGSARQARILMTLEEALQAGLADIEPTLCALDDSTSALISRMNGVPCLVFSKDQRLVGIVTDQDLL